MTKGEILISSVAGKTFKLLNFNNLLPYFIG
jgi:hypothetical protein